MKIHIFLFNEIEFMLKNKNCQWGKKTSFPLKFIFPHSIFFLQIHFMLVHFQENDTYIIF